jgi:hypothetical protein
VESLKKCLNRFSSSVGATSEYAALTELFDLRRKNYKYVAPTALEFAAKKLDENIFQNKVENR